MKVEHFPLAQRALLDDNEAVRSAALDLIAGVCAVFPDVRVPARGQDDDHSDATIRLVDDGFSTICDMLGDISLAVRTQACVLLGKMVGVGESFLLQTFDKKVMSHLRSKKTEHELIKEKKLGKKLPTFGDIDVQNLKMMTGGACGAFVHGLEDEYYEVREAAIKAICVLCLTSTKLAMKALDFLADMFNDEIDSVRIDAIKGMRQIAPHVVFQEEQLEMMLGMLDDRATDVRESMHALLGAATFANHSCVHAVVHTLLDNLKRYPADVSSIWRCMQGIGGQHSMFAEFLVEELLRLDNHFDVKEPVKLITCLRLPSRVESVLADTGRGCCRRPP